jgi:ubiquinone/menaquinone biosynthesis C-methylase UbiE
MSDYDRYVRSEWEIFLGDATRSRETLKALAGLEVRRVVDVGCGSGQELLPFAADLGASCVGVDLAPETGHVGRALFESQAPSTRVAFVRAAAESLPFPPDSFDAAICRLALPYTDNARCLSELSRVLRPGGALLLKIHHARYYAHKLAVGLRAGELPSVLHAARVLAAGLVYQITGKQPRFRIPSRETFQTISLLRRELAFCSLEIGSELRDSNPLTPSFLIIKKRK